jgi:hypothetical protein
MDRMAKLTYQFLKSDRFFTLTYQLFWSNRFWNEHDGQFGNPILLDSYGRSGG